MLSGVLQKKWDVVVIGAGLGGGTAGRRLAERGLSVLFLEKGPFNQDDVQAWPQGGPMKDDRFWHGPINGRIGGRDRDFSYSIGTGVGGSSLLYAASFERPERSDVENTEELPHPSGGWPVTYDQLLPYFEEVERQFFVRGTPDPLSGDSVSLLAPMPLWEIDAVMLSDFSRHGLHPYQVHQALRDGEKCLSCFGRVCPRGCKMDGRSAGVVPALQQGRSAVLDNCNVTAVRGTGKRVTHLEVERNGERAEISADRYILASGGLGSPRLLLASASQDWPEGCGNSSGLVGRNLMFHLLESIAIWPARRGAKSGPGKALTLRDFYSEKGRRYGLLQSSGLDAGYGEVLHAIRQRFAGSLIGADGFLTKVVNLIVWLGIAFRGKAKVYRAIIEDLPYENNRVVLDADDPARTSFEYTVADELRERRQEFRDMLKRRLKLPIMFLTADIELDISHACGTLRFGDDPRTSVLNGEGRFHDIDNLYAADASFMPTSCGVNPGLLTAAFAMRVADFVAASLGVK